MRAASPLAALGAALGIVLASSPALALEKVAYPMDRDLADPPDQWEASATTTLCSIAYANTCTGWIWVWDNWAPGETIGATFEPCCGGYTQEIVAAQVYFWTGASTGYGHTGSLTISSLGSNDCPGVVYDSHPLLPVEGAVDAHWTAPIPDGPVVVTYTNGPFPANYGVATDHPAAGPTGPQSCGLCFPSTRSTHTFLYGTPASPLCPGEPLNDGVCNAELVGWSVTYACIHDGPDAVESASWGAIKNLYR